MDSIVYKTKCSYFCSPICKNDVKQWLRKVIEYRLYWNAQNKKIVVFLECHVM